MARTYWTDGPTSIDEGRPFDAHVCRVLIQNNLEAVYEESRLDYCCVFDEVVIASEYVGPIIIPSRMDRDGLYRDLSIEPLAAGGDAGRTLTAYITPVWRVPSVTDDMYTTWSVSSGTTSLWQTASTIELSRYFSPELHQFPSGDEYGFVRFGYLFFRWSTTTGTNGPQLAGLRISEMVDD